MTPPRAKRPSQKQRLLQPSTHKYFKHKHFHLALYAPWWARSRKKRELGFMIRIRDPRTLCQHHCKPSWLDDGAAWCPQCGTRLKVRPGTLTIVPVDVRPRWRWLKIYVAKTRPERRFGKHGVVLFEAETHLTDGLGGRLTTKAFMRVKLGLGGAHV